jgi:hypothetical protein
MGGRLWRGGLPRQREKSCVCGSGGQVTEITLAMILRSFLFRLSQILALTTGLCLAPMSITFYVQLMVDRGHFFALLAVPFFAWAIVAHFVIRKIDPELIVEVARFLYPAGAVLCLALSIFLSILMRPLVPEEGSQHWILVFVGLGVAVFLGVRCLDIRWLRTLKEIEFIERRTR